jgi:hypothetical protein
MKILSVDGVPVRQEEPKPTGTSKKVRILAAKEDFEWYPTTDEILESFADDLYTMNDKEWSKRIEEEITSLKDRVKKLEGGPGCQYQNQKTITLDIEWPEADIGGLHFNAQKTHGVFELKEDGNYYSRDILFHSARDTDEGTGRDLLSEYLTSQDVKDIFIEALTDALIGFDDIRVFLPEENQGIKKYNGVDWWYWLRPRFSGSAAYCCYVHYDGGAGNNNAYAVGGCAPVFCVV